MVHDGHRTLGELISLDGKISLITGAASGIGRAIAERYAEAGSALMLVDIDREKLNNFAEILRGRKVDVAQFIVDLSRKEEIDRLWEEIGSNPPDILVNNAGIYPFRKFDEVDEEFLDRVLNINLKSVFWMCQKMIGAREDKGGAIINISSIEAILPFKDWPLCIWPQQMGRTFPYEKPCKRLQQQGLQDQRPATRRNKHAGNQECRKRHPETAARPDQGWP